MLGGRDPAGVVAGDFGGLGGVLGQVAGNHPVGDVAIGSDGDDAGLDLLAPRDRPSFRPGRVRVGGEPGGLGGVLDRIDQVASVEAGRGGQHDAGEVGVGAVEADDGVEVDDGPALHLGRFAVLELDRFRVDAPGAGPPAQVPVDPE